MQKAQELAQAVADSEVYKKMKSLEEKVQNDPDASRAMNHMLEMRQRVETLLSSANMDRNEMKRAGTELELAEKALNANDRIMELKAARKEFADMMDNVNRILRLVITGEIREDDIGGCGGSCSGCSGCGL